MKTKKLYITRKFVREYINLRLNIYNTISKFIKDVDKYLSELKQYPSLCKYEIRFYNKVRQTLVTEFN